MSRSGKAGHIRYDQMKLQTPFTYHILQRSQVLDNAHAIMDWEQQVAQTYRHFKQYRQCTYNATLRRVRPTIVAVGKQ